MGMKFTRYKDYEIVIKRIGTKWSYSIFNKNFDSVVYCCELEPPYEMFNLEELAIEAAFTRIGLCIQTDGIKFE